MLAWMGAARSVLRGAIGSFQVKDRHSCRHLRIGVARLMQGRQAVRQRLEGVGHERRTKARDAVPLADRDHLAHRVGRQLGRIEAVAIAPVDLEIEQRRCHPARLDIGALG